MPFETTVPRPRLTKNLNWPLIRLGAHPFERILVPPIQLLPHDWILVGELAFAITAGLASRHQNIIPVPCQLVSRGSRLEVLRSHGRRTMIQDSVSFGFLDAYAIKNVLLHSVIIRCHAFQLKDLLCLDVDLQSLSGAIFCHQSVCALDWLSLCFLGANSFDI